MPFALCPGLIVPGITVPSQRDLPSDQRIRFRLRTRTALQMREYQQTLEELAAMSFTDASPKIDDLLKSIVAGWDNVVDEAGKPVKFEDGLASLPVMVRWTWANELPSAAWTLTDDEKKRYASLSASPTENTAPDAPADASANEP